MLSSVELERDRVDQEDGVIRPFGLRDVAAVRRLQKQVVWLDLGHHLIQQRSPLQMALLAPVPWRGTGLASYVWQHPSAGVTGFIQVLQRPGRAEGDILCVTPGVEHTPEAEAVRQKLLEVCMHKAGEHGLRRLYASTGEDSAEISFLARMGFATYTKEDIYRLDGKSRSDDQAAQEDFRPQQPENAWWLRRLYHLNTPLPVQQAEGMNEKEGPSGLPLAWWELSQQRSFVWMQKGEIHGAIQIISGRRGHWLLPLGDPGDSRLMTALLQKGLAALAGSRWPIYSPVRDYQGGLRAVLADIGFTPLTRRARLVKHLAVRLRVPERQAIPAMAVEQSS